MAFALHRALQPGRLIHQFDAFDNPLGVGALGAVPRLADVLFGGVLVGWLVSVVAMVVRFHRSRGVERLQLKWITSAAVMLLMLFSAGPVIWSSGLPAWMWTVLAALAIGLLPAAAGVAVLRHRLYEIDRIVSRTVSYALITGVLVAVYGGSALALGQLLGPLAHDSQVAVAASTLLVAALFRPVRERVQSAVDRRFNRARYDAQRTVDAFAARLRGEVDLAQVNRALIGAVTATVQPATVWIWFADDGTRP